ncbi:MAG TPA: beta-propeller domain-containing protein, partial [Myxococcales bacterium]|nr:beta-propeller domain-containing protein [Myxococcales bacterium]
MARAGIVVVLLITLAVMVAGGCQEPRGGFRGSLPPLPEMPAIVQHVSLTTPSGSGACADAEQLIEDQVVLSMRVQMRSERNACHIWAVQNWGCDAGFPGGPTPGPGSYSTTNLQTAGVDEADAMKNDGTRLFTLNESRLFLLQSWPDTDLQIRGQLDLGQPQHEMLLVAPDRLVVFSAGPTTRATFVDISNLASPLVIGTVDLPGRYLSARRVGTAIRVVLRSTFSFPPGVKVSPSSLEEATSDAWYAAREAENESLIRGMPLSYWLPPATTGDATGQVQQWPHACDQLSVSNAPVSLGLTAVATLDASDPTRVDRWSMLGEADIVYATQTSLYLASHHWWWWWQPGQISATYVHRFDISSPATAAHVASGVFDGTLPDSFGLDELDGRLRVAAGEAGFRDGGFVAANRVLVLEPRGRELVEVGRTDFAVGERMESARFLGDRAFVVTFRQVDPLFTLDMSDPAAPRVVGELTVPGFSTYLHPVGDDRLAAVGIGPFGGAHVSLFDVSDLAQPRLVMALPLGQNGASQATREHRAFTWLPEQKLFAVPYSESLWNGSGYDWRTELKVFQVGVSLTALGTLSLTDAMPNGGYW